uniref:Uncharacterized protein n=1 Tax=Emiliania huxleyi TaxID=2903 RepID=A0A7S3TNV7_EMIHU
MAAALLLAVTSVSLLRPRLPQRVSVPLRGRVQMLARPSAAFESYRTVGVVCTSCRARLFGYKKKNGLKSSLIKLYIERICADPLRIISDAPPERRAELGSKWHCPTCKSAFARTALIHGKPALKLAGGKVSMVKK